MSVVRAEAQVQQRRRRGASYLSQAVLTIEDLHLPFLDGRVALPPVDCVGVGDIRAE